MGKKLTREQAELRTEAARLYRDDGLSITHVAAQLGVSRTTIYRWLHAYNVPMRPIGGPYGRRSAPPAAQGAEWEQERARQLSSMPRVEMDMILDAITLQRNGWPVQRIAEEMGVTPQHVTKWFRRWGYDVVTEHIETITAMYADGATLAVITAATGVPLTGRERERAYRMMAERGVQRRTRGESVALARERARRADPLVCNRCEILMDAMTETGCCEDCDWEREHPGKVRMMPSETEMIKEALGATRILDNAWMEPTRLSSSATRP